MVVKHALRSALVPVVTIFGLDVAFLLSGTVFTETDLRPRGHRQVGPRRDLHQGPAGRAGDLAGPCGVGRGDEHHRRHRLQFPRPESEAVDEHRDNGGAAARPYLEVDGLTVRFPTADGLVQAVTDLTYRSSSARPSGIVGESGSGKSVSSMAVLGLHDRRPPRSAARSGSAAPRSSGCPSRKLRDLRGNSVAMIFQDALAALHPFYKIGKQLSEAYLIHHPQPHEARCPSPGDRDARPSRHPAAGQAGRPVPAPVLRRHAAARDDRDGPDQRPVATHRRRADHRARRHRPGADPRPAPGPAA